MRLSVAIPVYDDIDEAVRMVAAVQASLAPPIDAEYFLVDVQGDGSGRLEHAQIPKSIRILTAMNLPAAKNRAAGAAKAEFLLFLSPGIFPTGGAVETLLRRLEGDSSLTAVTGRWFNAHGKLEIGYNVRRFPTLSALILDILLLNKFFPHNRATRRYKMHDFDHRTAIPVEHANDCVFMIRRSALGARGSFNEAYAPGWFDQVEFCRSLRRAGGQIVFEPAAEFMSNENVPIIDRMVRDQYLQYRIAERRFIRNHFGAAAAAFARACLAAGMVQRIAFSLALPLRFRTFFLKSLRSYVNDRYVRDLRPAYWTVLRRSLWGQL